MLALTLRGLRAHKRRLVSTLVAVMLGVAFMTGSLVFTDTLRAALDGVFKNAERNTDALVRGPVTVEGYNGDIRAPLDAGLVDTIAAVEGVAEVAPRLEGFAQVVGKDGEAVDDLSSGAQPAGAAWSESRELNPFTLVEGRGPRAGDEVVVDRSLAEEAGLAPGERTRVLTSTGVHDMTVTGVATFGDADNRAGNRTVLFTLDAAATMLGKGDVVDSIAVAAESGADPAALTRGLEQAVGAQADVTSGAALAEEIAAAGNEDLEFFGTFMKMFAAVALLVGSFIISNTFAILVAQRTRELALLRALGASRRQVRRSVVTEAATIGVVASAIGLGAGVGVAIGIRALWDSFGVSMPEGPLVMRPLSMAIAFGLGVVVTVVSALLPARRAARVAPVEAMRASSTEKTRPSKVRVVLGLVLIVGSAAAVVGGIVGGEVAPVLAGAFAGFLGVATLSPTIARPVVRVIGAGLPRFLGMRGHLARENALRNPRRTAATASALMIGVALVGTFTIFAASGKWSVSHSFDQEFRGDLVLETGAWSFGGVSPELADKLTATDEVEVAVGRHFTLANIDGSRGDLTVWPAASIERVFDLGVEQGSLKLGTDGLAVGTAHAEEKGWRLGDRVPVTFTTGAQREMEIRALFSHPDWTGLVWMDREAYRAIDSAAMDSSVYIRGAEGVSPGQLRRVTDGLAGAYGGIEVMNREQMRDLVIESFNSMLGVVYGLLALAIIIALIGIGNTVALAVVERTRELGLLRAVGMTRGQLRSMVRWEAAVVALYGTALGMVIAFFLARALVFAIQEAGIETARTVVPYGQLAVIVVLAASCGVLAALLPARRAGRLDVLQAIAAE